MQTYQASVRAQVRGRSQVIKTEVRALNAQEARWLLWAQWGFHSIQWGPTQSKPQSLEYSAKPKSRHFATEGMKSIH